MDIQVGLYIDVENIFVLWYSQTLWYLSLNGPHRKFRE